MAAAASRATTTQVAVDRPKPNQRMRAVVENSTPMAWANRLGGPATSFGSHGRRGATTRLANWPSGLIVGPVSNLAQNP